jgi:hypothetical protein
MSEEKQSDELGFGQKLLGMQGFSAARAERYRAEISKLLIDLFPVLLDGRREFSGSCF